MSFSGGSRWALRLLLVGLGVLYLFSNRPAPLLEGWKSDFGEALSEAAASNRHVLIAFSMPGCPPCVAMERTVLGTRAVRAALSDFVPARVDITGQPELANRFGVFATPTYAIVDFTGRLLAKSEGQQSIDEFLRFLSRGRDMTGSGI